MARKRFTTDLVQRDALDSIDAEVNRLSKYPESIRTHGLECLIELRDYQKMSVELAHTSVQLQTRLVLENPTVRINVPEVFPYDDRRCIVLVTGHVPELIVVK